MRIDATYFKRFCALCYQDHEDGYTQLVRFSVGEHFEEIREDLTNLLRLGVHIESITTDGHKSVLKAIKKSLPDAIVQRCLVPWYTSSACVYCGLRAFPNIWPGSNCANWCFKSWRSKPRTTVFTGLQEKTFNQSTGRYWHTHKLLRRSYLTIKRALPNMFHYLTNPKIPATTNGIEGFFSHLKNHLDLHRGLTLKHRVNFIKWYVYLSNHK